MHVVFGIFWDAVVDHVRDAGNIDAARRHVGCHQHIILAIAEALQCFHAVLLRDIAMHRHHFGMTTFLENVRDLICFFASARENNHTMPFRSIEQRDEQFIALIHRNRIKGMRHSAGDRALGDFHTDWVLQAPLRKGLDRRRHRCREQQRLPLIPRAKIDDPANLGQEAHVQHAIHFIEHEDFQRTKTHRCAVKVIHQATWSRHHDVRAFFQLLRLLAITNAAIQQCRF